MSTTVWPQLVIPEKVKYSMQLLTSYSTVTNGSMTLTSYYSLAVRGLLGWRTSGENVCVAIVCLWLELA